LLRAKKRSHLDRFENEEIQFHERVKSSYYKIAKENSQRIKIINGEQTEEKLFEDVLKIINSNLKNGE
jgi:dTMP kinase